MLAPLIALTWIAVAVVVLALCRAAARAEAAAKVEARSAGERGITLFPGLTVWEPGAQIELRRSALRRTFAPPRLSRRRGHAAASPRRSRSRI